MHHHPLSELPVASISTPTVSPLQRTSLKRPLALTPGESALSPSKRRILLEEGILQPDFGKGKKALRSPDSANNRPGIVGLLLESPEIIAPSASKTRLGRSDSQPTHAKSHTRRASYSMSPPSTIPSTSSRFSSTSASSSPIVSTFPTSMTSPHYPGFDVLYDPDSFDIAYAAVLSQPPKRLPSHEDRDKENIATADMGEDGARRVSRRARLSESKSPRKQVGGEKRKGGQKDSEDVVMQSGDR